MVASGGGDFERALGAFLALDLAQVAGGGVGGDLAGFGGGEGGLAGVVAHHLVQRACGQDLRPADPGGLGAAGAGAEERAVLFGSGHGGGEGADDGDQAAVERQFAERHRRLDLVMRQDVQRGEQRERDGQVEMRAFLGQVGGREVHGDAFGRQRDGHG